MSTGKLRELVENKQWNEARRTLYELATIINDYSSYCKLCRLRNKIEHGEAGDNADGIVKIALLGGATTELIQDPLLLAVETVGFRCDVYRSDYNDFAREMLDGESGAVEFQPQVAVIVNTPFNQPAWPEVGDGSERVERLVEETCSYWFSLCQSLHAKTGCEIVMNNFHALPTRALGNLGIKLTWDEDNFLRRVNLRLGDSAPAFVHINDVAGLAARYGVDHWFDQRYWYHAKLPVSFDCLLPYVRNTANIIKAIMGQTAKCIVLDLDNTLWHGVVGDDGVDGIVVGEGSAVGEAFKAFQYYLRKLKHRGIMLAVCSKNDEVNAFAPFREHPEMVLKPEDFVNFKANWRPKPINIQEIANELNIGLDALVFVDDNPAERALVHRELPQVKVVELGGDPADYPRALEDSGWFEITVLSEEDQRRTSQYKENANRQELKSTISDYDEFLVALEQKAVVRSFEVIQLDRVTQLINKTNQFNLTTRRMSRSEVENVMRKPDDLTAYVRLADRFGDNGLISVFWGRRQGRELEIEQWLMSCRVFNRGVERLLCNFVVDAAKAMGVNALRGSYIPTKRNSLVKNHYESLGFEKVCERNSGETEWYLKIDDYVPFDTVIEIVEDIET